MIRNSENHLIQQKKGLDEPLSNIMEVIILIHLKSFFVVICHKNQRG